MGILPPVLHRTRSLLAIAAAALTAACATPRAQVRAEPPPPLVVPVPPPRIILPPDPALPAVADVPEPLVEPPPPRPSRPASARTETARAEDRPADAGNGGRVPGAGDGASAQAPTEVRPEEAADVALRRQLEQAFQDLQRVDYAMLSNDLKAQYDTARRFIVLGEQALKERNRLFAATLADKANAIATSLLRR